VTAGQAVRLERRAKPARPAQQGLQGRPDRPAPPARLEHQGIPGRRAQPDRRTRGTPSEAGPDHLPRPIRRSRPSPFRQGTTCSWGSAIVVANTAAAHEVYCVVDLRQNGGTAALDLAQAREYVDTDAQSQSLSMNAGGALPSSGTATLKCATTDNSTNGPSIAAGEVTVSKVGTLTVE
jgi:hypothetical protein